MVDDEIQVGGRPRMKGFVVLLVYEILDAQIFGISDVTPSFECGNLQKKLEQVGELEVGRLALPTFPTDTKTNIGLGQN